MQRSSIPWIWILLPVAILLMPGPARRILLDLLGGLTLTLLLLPLLLGGLALIGWQLLRRRLRTCETCGFSSLGTTVCPACGTPFPDDACEPEGAEFPVAQGIWKGRGDRELDARNATINVEAVDVDGGDVPSPRKGKTGEAPASGGSTPPSSAP